MTQASIDRRTLLAGAAASLGAVTTAAAAPSPFPTSLPGPWTSSGTVDRGVGKIHWASLGEGPGEPLVLMHKLGGWLADWRALAPMLAKGRRVIAMDMPGHGDSTMVGKPPEVWTPAESAALVRQALHEMGVDRFSIAGNSLGGCIGVVLAARWPEAVTSLSLISVALASALSREETLKQDASIRAQYGPNWEPLPRSAAQVSQFGTIDSSISDEQNMSRAKAGVWIRPCERGVGYAGMDAHLPMITAPTLLLLADRGPYVRFETVARAKLKNVQIEKMANVGSFLHQEKPAETAAILNRFLAKA